MNTYFSLSDFWRIQHNKKWHIEPTPSNRDLDQILENHFLPMNQVRSNLNIALKVTRCYATKRWERKQGRDGSSQHCFPHHEFSNKRGACDIDIWDDAKSTKVNYKKLANLLLESPYKRICWYPNLTFFHCDYKANTDQLFINSKEGWSYISESGTWINKIKE